MNIKAAIWDLDGTLLNTLDDLAASTNAALAANGLPTHTTDEVRMFVGNGIGKLIERAVPNGRENPKFQAVYDAFVAHYGAHSRDRTKALRRDSADAGRIGRAGRKAGDCFQQD